MPDAPPAGLRFGLEVPPLPAQWPLARTEVSAEFSVVTTAPPHSGFRPQDIALLIAVDVGPRHLEALRPRLEAALGGLPAGVRYAVLGGGGGDDHPVPCFPAPGLGWAVRDFGDAARAEAVLALRPHRGPASAPGLAPWLDAAASAFARTGVQGRAPARVRHLLLITDGARPYDPALGSGVDAHRGRFSCDVLLVGDAWHAGQLHPVAYELGGAPTEAGPGPGALAEWVKGAFDRVRAPRTAEESLIVTAREGVTVEGLIQSRPDERPLTAREDAGRADGASRVVTVHEYPLHYWTPGRRGFVLRLSLDATADRTHAPLQLAMVSLGGVHAPVTVVWRLPGERAPDGEEASGPGPYGDGAATDTGTGATGSGDTRSGTRRAPAGPPHPPGPHPTEAVVCRHCHHLAGPRSVHCIDCGSTL